MNNINSVINDKLGIFCLREVCLREVCFAHIIWIFIFCYIYDHKRISIDIKFLIVLI